jgi:hypothetical protein
MDKVVKPVPVTGAGAIPTTVPAALASAPAAAAAAPGRRDSEVILYQLDTSSRVILITGRLLLNVLAVRQEKIVTRWKM